MKELNETPLHAYVINKEQKNSITCSNKLQRTQICMNREIRIKKISLQYKQGIGSKTCLDRTCQVHVG